MVLGVAGIHVLGAATDHGAEFHLPVRAVPAEGDHDPVVRADHRAARRLEEEIGHAAVLAPLAAGFAPLLLGARLVDVAVEVDRRVQDLPRVHDGREDPHVVEVVNEGGSAAPGQPAPRHEVVDDLVQPEPDPVLVAADEVDHVGRRRDGWIGGVPLEVPVRLLDVDDERVPQHEGDARHAADLERPHLEGFRDLDLRPSLGRQRSGEHQGRGRQERPHEPGSRR